MQEINVAETKVEDIWVSGPELCRRLGVSRSTVKRMRQRGLPHVGHDRLRRYHLPTVLQWLSEHA
jgi:biotin operon repressor